MRNAWLMMAVVISGCVTHPSVGPRQVAADTTEGTFSLTPYEWDGKLSTGDAVSITNAFGDLRVRSSIEGHVVVSGQVQRFSGDDRDIDVALKRVTGGYTIVVTEIKLPPDNADAGTERGSNGQFDGRIDMALLLPHTSPLTAETRSGLLQLKDYRGSATLTTADGKIEAITPAAIRATAGAGEIRVHFRGTEWTRASELATRTGPIMVTVPEAADLDITATTGGELSATLGVAAASHGNSLQVTLGTGAHRLSVRSRSGAIALHRDGID